MSESASRCGLQLHLNAERSFVGFRTPFWSVSTVLACCSAFALSNVATAQTSDSYLIVTIAGNGSLGFSGDGRQASVAALSHPQGLALDTSGNLYVADSGNNRIRRVSPNGVISTVAGNGNAGFSGDGGPATAATLYPEGLAVDTSATFTSLTTATTGSEECHLTES
jgi:hypothetical protein